MAHHVSRHLHHRTHVSGHAALKQHPALTCGKVTAPGQPGGLAPTPLSGSAPVRRLGHLAKLASAPKAAILAASSGALMMTALSAAMLTGSGPQTLNESQMSGTPATATASSPGAPLAASTRHAPHVLNPAGAAAPSAATPAIAVPEPSSAALLALAIPLALALRHRRTLRPLNRAGGGGLPT